MPLSPLAALAVPMATDAGWRASAASFADRVRDALQEAVNTDSFRAAWKGLDEGLTYMDWSVGVTGFDMSYVWDPELWVKLKTAVAWNQPTIFWNSLWDRIQYSEYRIF